MGQIEWGMSLVSKRLRDTVRVGGYGSEDDPAGVVVCLCWCHLPMDYPTKTLRARKAEMRVRRGRIVGEGRWGGFAGKVAVWPLQGAGKSIEMRREKWREKRDQEMGGR
jgi:hypothetical protein